MIAAVGKRGSWSSGVLYYLMGPGRRDEHENPRVIGSWDGHPESFVDISPRELGRMLDAPLSLGDLERGKKTVWHTSIRNADSDRILSDDEWAEIAQDMLDRTGIARRGDLGAARWVVVRHGDDHVHVVATLARQDTGERVAAYNDYKLTRETCLHHERRLGLTSTAKSGGGRPGLSKLEHERAQEKPFVDRYELAEEVRAVLARSNSESEFLEGLDASGIMVGLRTNDNGDITGYKVSHPFSTADDGRPLWFGGSKLHRTLSWPQVQARLARKEQSKSDGQRPAVALSRDPEALVRQVQSRPTDELIGEGLDEELSELLQVAARRLEGTTPGPLHDAARRFADGGGWARADGYQVEGRSAELARLGLWLAIMPRRTDATARYLVALSVLLELSAEVRELQGRVAEARTANEAAGEIRGQARQLESAQPRTPDSQKPNAPTPAAPAKRPTFGGAPPHPRPKS